MVRRMGKRATLSRVAALVLIALGGLAAGMTLVTRGVVRDQERRLLSERSREVASTASTSVNDLKALLGLLAGVPSRTRNSRSKFARAADPLLVGGVDAVGVARERRGRIVVVAGAGAGPASGQALNGEGAALVLRALSTHGLVGAVIHDGGASELTVDAPGPDGTVAYEQAAIDPRPIPSPPGSPYSDLNIALYASARPVPSELVLTSSVGHSPSGTTDRRLLTVGSERWLLVTGARQPLVGSFTENVPWLVLAVTLLAALLATALVELLARRRAYALGIAERRTVELRQALEEQVRLEHRQRQARDAADAANRAKSEFLSRMSHELRTPLNAILGFGQLLELDLVDPQREHVGHILKGGNHLLDLINEILELSRIETGELQLSPEPVPIADTVREAVALVRPLADRQDISLNADMSAVDGDGHVLADRQRLKQVMLNLLSNAIKYNRVGGRVHISLARAGDDEIEIVVADTGIGIPRERLAAAFEPFERLGAERGDIEGTGLGLALSKRLLEAMGGSIRLESEPGQGTTVTVALRAVDAPGTETDTSERPETEERVIAGSEDRRHQILYIEDNLSNLTLVQRILQRHPALELVPAMQGTIGLELAREHRPDLIVLDVHLPDMPGEEVLRRLRADEATSAIPVVVLSADASSRQIARLLDAGATDYLTKPLDVQRFLDVIVAHLDSSEPSPAGSG